MQRLRRIILPLALAICWINLLGLIGWHLYDSLPRRSGEGGDAQSPQTVNPTDADRGGELSIMTFLEDRQLEHLEVRENVEFILTPAILIQSSIREDLITYPED